MTAATTTKRLNRYVQIGGLAAGVVWFALKLPFAPLGWFMLACAVAQLANVVLLSRGRHIPFFTGRSIVGQALQSEGALALGTLVVAGDRIPAALGWSVAAVGTAAFILGLRFETKAQQSPELAEQG